MPNVKQPNVKQAVPFFHVANMEDSLRFYREGLGFKLTNQWQPEGRIRWCWLELGDAALMLEEYLPGQAPTGTKGQGVSLCFMCADALAIYREMVARSLAAERPFVGNRLWVASITDPDGYRLHFESPTDAPEETVFTG